VNGSAAFFQVALALIPAILFGGAALEARRKQEKSKTKPRKNAGRIVLVAIFVAGLAAEVIAIRGAIEPASVADWERSLLALAIMAGSVGLAIWILAPALDDGGGFSFVEKAAAGALVVVLAVAGFWWIESSLGRANVSETYDAAAAARLEAARELRAAEGSDFAARADLILLAGSTKRPTSAVSTVVDALQGLEVGAYRRIRRGVSPTNIEPRVQQAFGFVSAVDRRLRRGFRTGLTGLDDSEHLLLVLAERRMISAAKLVMTTAVKKTAAREEIESLCAPGGRVVAC
jgi:hypothetical protein